MKLIDECFDSMLRKPGDWQILYEMQNGSRTGRFQLVNERGEKDLIFPGFILGESAV